MIDGASVTGRVPDSFDCEWYWGLSGVGRGAVRTKSSPTGPAEHDEGGSLLTKCQY